MSPNSETKAVLLARQALERGDLFAAYEVVSQALEMGTATTDIHYLEVLTLARMGDVEEALRRYEEHDLAAEEDVDVLALRARLHKDVALLGDGPEASDLLWKAAEAYAAIHACKGGYFPLINAATLALLAGRADIAQAWASQVLDDPLLAQPGSYWEVASKAEALLVLGRLAEAGAELKLAANLPDASLGARSSTVRQLERLIAHIPSAHADLIAILRPGPVAHFCGHIFVADQAVEDALASQIEAELAGHRITIAYGALASGADILFAETLLKRGGELHVVLPFERDDFVTYCVVPAGDEWLDRFCACVAAATSVTYASGMNYVGDDQQFAYGSRVAMGMARLRANQICSASVQLAIWDGVPQEGDAGTAADVRLWQGIGGSTIIVPADNLPRAFPRPQPPQNANERSLQAMVFTDFPGFSKLPEPALPHFWREVMNRSATMLERFQEDILCQNTWGDAIYLVLDDPATAAEVALSLREALQDADFASMGMNEASNMRVAVHYGLVYRAHDHIQGRTNFFGTEVSKAARVEPVTPPGSIYVTEPFAAALETQGLKKYRLNYVGLLNLAKSYGSFRLYRLSRR